MVTGPPGAGKSTVAEVLAAEFERSVLVRGDDFFGFLARGAIEPWLPESHEQNEVVTAAAASATGSFVRGGYATVYDGVVGPWFLPVFAAATGLDLLDYVVLLPSVDTCVDRVVTRTGHGFTDEAATRVMHAEFADAATPARHVITDLPDGAAEVVKMIVEQRAAGRFVYAASA